MYFRAALTIAVALALSGCASSGGTRGRAEDVGRERYLLGIEAMASGDYEEAIGHFRQVMRIPGLVQLGANSRLRIADALFLQEKFEAAITSYRNFTKEYPNDANAGYAQFRIGHAFYEQIPGEWFLAPPQYERQQNFVRQAAAALKQFVRLYPTHPLVEQGQGMLDSCEEQLLAHELYVARFYFDRDKPHGVVQRLERAFDRFPEHASTEDNFLMLARAYVSIERLDAARSMYQAYLDRFPRGEHRAAAQSSITVLDAAIQRSAPAVPDERPSTPEPEPAPEAEGDSEVPAP